jgi:lysophospholipase L1-like esterase
VPVTALVATLCPLASASAGGAAGRWVTGWAPSMFAARVDDALLTSVFPSGEAVDQTVRMIARATIAGRRIRLRFSNRDGDRPVVFGSVTVGLRTEGPSVKAGTLRPVRFLGARRVTVPPGADVLSDPVTFPVSFGDELAVSMSVVGASGAVTWHRWAKALAYVTPVRSGDDTGDATGAAYREAGMSWFWLDGVDEDTTAGGTVVALGDSITDGWPTAPDQYETWPDVLADRVPGHRLGVVNAGISGNQLMGDDCAGGCGAPAVARLDHDALDLAGVTTLVVFEGTNDLYAARAPASRVVSALRWIVGRARQRRLRVLGATITPRSDRGWTAAMEADREAVNGWIRNSKAFDAVLDFDAVVRDPTDPHQLAPEYDSGDGLHPNALGLRAMAESIDLGALGPGG